MKTFYSVLNLEDGREDRVNANTFTNYKKARNFACNLRRFRASLYKDNVILITKNKVIKEY